MLPYCIPLLYDALPAPNNPASYPLSGPGAAIPLPCRKCSKRGFSIGLHPAAPPRAETPLIESAAKPYPHCKCSKQGFRFAAGHKALLGAETPLSTSEALRLWGWRLAGIAKPQPKNKAGAGDQPGVLRVHPLP